MPDDSRFVKKSLGRQFIDIFTIIFDLVSCFVLGVPLLLETLIKQIQGKRKDIRGKLALVTGGGNGLGRGISLKLAELGCNVAVVDVNIKAANATVLEIESKGGKAKAYKADVTKADEIEKLRDELFDDLGPVDILVNNAGLMSNNSLDDNCSSIELMIKVNVLGPILMSKLFLEQMKEHGSGHIVCIASTAGLHPTPHNIPYVATKHAVNGFMAALTEHLRLEKWRSRIKTTCIFPYYIKTRQEVIDFLNPNIRFPPLEIEEAAHEAVEGILREDHAISIPRNQIIFFKFINLLPFSIRELVCDRLLREREVKDPICKTVFKNE